MLGVRAVPLGHYGNMCVFGLEISAEIAGLTFFSLRVRGLG
jgi:hypothetical protein